MSRYASNTTVSAEKSRIEIERTLARYGAGAFMYGTKDSRAIIQFEMTGKRIRFDLPLPSMSNFEKDGRRAKRSRERQLVAWEKSCRQKWRALSLAVKAKLEAVDSGITTFEEEFMAHIVLPDGSTAGAWMIPQIENAYLSKTMPLMLPEAKV